MGIVKLALAAMLSMGGVSRASEEALKYFTPEEIERGAAFARQRRILWVCSLAWSAAVLVALSHAAVGGRFVRAASMLSRTRPLAAAALAIALLLAAYVLARSPFAWLRGFFLEHAWGLSTQTAWGFLADWLKAACVQITLATAALWLLVVLRAVLPTWWPLAAWGASAVLLLLYVAAAPVLLDPLFNRFSPVTEPEIRDRALGVARRAGIDAKEVLWVDASRRTRRVNAYFTGIGATKRIVLYDNLKRTDVPSEELLDELEVILAHEAAHWKHGHVWKGTVLTIAACGLFFAVLWFLLDRFHLWGVPNNLPEGARGAVGTLLLAGVVSFLLMPVANAISRSWERLCDSESLALTGKHQAYIRAEVELARSNISEIEPGRLTVFWLYTHPPVLERIRLAAGQK